MAKISPICPVPSAYDISTPDVLDTLQTAITLHVYSKTSASIVPQPADPLDKTSSRSGFLGIQDAGGQPNWYTVAAAAHLNQASPLRHAQHHNNTQS
eukprot:scaffold96840_cov14-Tisochrysis_lutea.AAC.1